MARREKNYPHVFAALKQVAKALQEAMDADDVDHLDLHLRQHDPGSIGWEVTTTPREEYGDIDVRSPEQLAAEEAAERELDAKVTVIGAAPSAGQAAA